MSLSGAGTLCQIGLRKKFELKLSNNSIFGGLKCNCQFGYILCLFLDYFNKFLCIISVPNLNGGNVPKFHVRNIPNFEVGNVPNLKLGNCIQSIITLPGHYYLWGPPWRKMSKVETLSGHKICQNVSNSQKSPMIPSSGGFVPFIGVPCMGVSMILE